jgi:peptidoglycan/LPS O-acetylase OafA/YrhL
MAAAAARPLLLAGAAALALLLVVPGLLSPLVLVAAGDDGWTYGRASFVSGAVFLFFVGGEGVLAVWCVGGKGARGPLLGAGDSIHCKNLLPLLLTHYTPHQNINTM